MRRDAPCCVPNIILVLLSNLTASYSRVEKKKLDRTQIFSQSLGSSRGLHLAEQLKEEEEIRSHQFAIWSLQTNDQ